MRIVRGLGALALLLVLVAGVPVALAGLGGNPFPASLSLDDLRRTLLTPDDGSVLVGVITVVGWLAWLVFAVSVVSELVGLVSGYRVRIRLPGLAGPQQFVAGLLLAVVTMVTGPQATMAAPVPPPDVSISRTVEPPAPAEPGTASAVPAGARTAPTAVTAQPASAPDGVRHTVVPGDDLWSLAERYYGEGRDWRKIAVANPDRLTGGPDRLVPGWTLLVPDAQARPEGSTRSVVVQEGDSLSSIADKVYGSQSRWDDLFTANRAQLSDPDQIEPGTRLLVPVDAPADEQPRRSADADEKPAERAAPEKPTESAESAEPERPAEPEPRLTPPTASDPDRAPSTRPKAAPAPTTAPTQVPSAQPETPTQPTTAPEQVPSTQPETPTRPTSAPTAESAPVPAEVRLDTSTEVAAAVATVGGLLAAGLAGGLALRRRGQLQARPLGRRIPPPAGPARQVEAALGRRQRPLSLRTLDLATRAIAAHSRFSDLPIPSLVYATVADQRIEMTMADGTRPDTAPPAFEAIGHQWRLHPDHAEDLKDVPGVADAARPYPALVSLGRDDEGRQVLADLETVGLLVLRTDAPELAEATLAALAVELSFSPWAEEMTLTLIGTCEPLPEALGRHGVSVTDDVEAVLGRLEHRAVAQRAHRSHAVLAQHRADPGLADPWAPEIVLVNHQLSQDQERRFSRLLLSEPRVALAVVTTHRIPDAPCTLALLGAGSTTQAVLEPYGLAFTPQLIEAPAAAAVIELIRTTGREDTQPAPWWDDRDDSVADVPDNVMYLGPRLGGGTEAAPQTGVSMTVLDQEAGASGIGAHHPTLLILGPIELVGAAGDPPPRAGKSCLEYCGWLLENPGTSAQAMASALVVAEGTRRSNVSRLRGWLGVDADGEAYLPDAYTGRISLHPSVSSDWLRLRMLIGSGVNRTSSTALEAALRLVRGAPLADAAPYQWHWAEELRTDMVSVVRDVGVELTHRALEDGNLDLARWAAGRSLAAAPGDELLMAGRIRTEHQAGNVPEVERLALQVASQSRILGVDLADSTVELLQQVMEGRVRARMA